MFIFAHAGLTLGAATLVSGVMAGRNVLRKRRPVSTGSFSTDTSREVKRPLSEIIGLKALSGFLDIRLLLFGSLFPDIIDKPLEFIGFGNGRSITHTLLISLVFLVTGFFVNVNYKKTWLVVIALGMCSHLILDLMWLNPHTLFWPVYGWSFPTPEQGIGLAQFSLWWSTLTTNLTVDITEGLGAAVLLFEAWIIASQREIKLFVTKGKI
jgi:inner membrane protein